MQSDRGVTYADQVPAGSQVVEGQWWTPNQQGPDFGTQYRSAIFFHDADQEKAARASKEEQDRSGRFRRPIVTEIVPAGTFWDAEGYHQRYYSRRGMAAACRL